MGVENRHKGAPDPQGHVRFAEPGGRVDRARILAAVARVDHESEFRAGRHPSTFALFLDRRTVEVTRPQAVLRLEQMAPRSPTDWPWKAC